MAHYKKYDIVIHKTTSKIYLVINVSPVLVFDRLAFNIVNGKNLYTNEDVPLFEGTLNKVTFGQALMYIKYGGGI